MAGFGTSESSEANGGTFSVYALGDDGNGIDDLIAIEIWLNGQGTGSMLPLTPNGYGTLDIPIDPGVLSEGEYLVELAPIDESRTVGDIWPYLTVSDQPLPAPRVRRPNIQRLVEAPQRLLTSWREAYERSINRPSPGFDPPVIFAAGYWDTRLSSVSGGQLTILAFVLPGEALIDRVEVYLQGRPLGVTLLDNGLNGDFAEGDDVYGFTFPFRPGELLPGRVLLELRAFDDFGTESTPWPYYNVTP